MDPVESINIETDTSFALGLEAQARGHKLYYYQPKDLSIYNGQVKASISEIAFQKESGEHFTLGKKIFSSFNDIDVVLMRQDPPFDMNYITYTHLLERLPKTVLVLNNPAEVRNAPEKIFVLNFAHLMPPTLISANFKEVEEFFHEHNNIILKPLYAHGGADINQITKLEDLSGTFNELINQYNAPLIAQKFLKEVKDGDKRVILIDGEVAGAINRIPPAGDIRSNTAIGGSAHKTELTKRDQEICDAIGPELKKRGLTLAGIDIIGGYITEINVTSPTGIPFIDDIYDTNLSAIFWDCVEGYTSDSKK